MTTNHPIRTISYIIQFIVGKKFPVPLAEQNHPMVGRTKIDHCYWGTRRHHTLHYNLVVPPCFGGHDVLDIALQCLSDVELDLLVHPVWKMASLLVSCTLLLVREQPGFVISIAGHRMFGRFNLRAQVLQKR